MQNVKQHIAFKILSILLLITILTPSVVKLMHVFENHAHEVCIDNQKTHLHTLDLECEFYKFKVNNTFTLPNIKVDFLVLKVDYKLIQSEYSFETNYKPLHFSLRAPPQLV